MNITEVGTLLGSEWKGLSESEKKVRGKPQQLFASANIYLQKYIDAQARDHQRYITEYKSVYGKDPPMQKAPSKK